MNTQENNKLIAEFMGMQKGHPDKDESRWENDWFEKLTIDGNIFESGRRHSEPLGFHSSWDWLMPVVDKIESDERFDVNVLQYGTIISSNTKERGHIEIVNNVANISFDSKIDHTYQAVVEFIKQHNNQ
jgi:hypothetical protein